MPHTPRPIRILLVDDSQHVLWGLSKLIDAERPRMAVVGKARSIAEALEAARVHQPDVVLLDIFLAEGSSLEHLPELLQVSDARVLVLTGACDPELHRQALERGARGVVVKGEPAATLLQEIEHTHACAQTSPAAADEPRFCGQASAATPPRASRQK
jgi:two-component system nitrate/nitrite response regulator NarL